MLLVLLIAWMPGFVLRVRAPGKLICDKLFGQEHLKMILLLPFAADFLAANARAVSDAVPHGHGNTRARTYTSHAWTSILVSYE